MHKQTPPPASILYLDAAFAIVNKPPGMPSQPTRSQERGTAIALVRDRLKQNQRKHDFVAAAHRLDAPTSGLLCIAVERGAARNLQEQFTKHTAGRIYLAIVEGEPSWDEQHLIDQLELDRASSWAKVVPEGGREARTQARVLCRQNGKSLLILAPETGLTHQLRVQLAHRGHPISGDARYGKGGQGRLALHAYALSLRHPTTKQTLHVEAAPSPDFWGTQRFLQP
jgi:RluA family pseudouridine synthase